MIDRAKPAARAVVRLVFGIAIGVTLATIPAGASEPAPMAQPPHASFPANDAPAHDASGAVPDQDSVVPARAFVGPGWG
jgi:hypothetical protein